MTYFDSSVLVAAVRADEEHHPACLAALKRGGCTSSHAILEVFSILTGGKSARRYSPAFAARVIEVSFERQISHVTLTWREIHHLLAEAHSRGIRGGAIYDYQHLACARKAGAVTLLTLNTKDFLSFSREGDPTIESPA